jgi:large subunit ribosomal protein L3
MSQYGTTGKGKIVRASSAVFSFMANKFFIGTKGRMTQVFNENGEASAATVISATPMTVTQVKTAEKDGYVAMQLAVGDRKAKNIAKPQQGHFKDLGNFRFVRETREGEMKEKGAKIDVSVFAPGDVVAVSAISKGKGFQGVVKRHGFHGGPRSHGQKNKERAPGSIGGAARAGGRVAKNMRMAGRMGGDRVTVRNLRVLQVDATSNTIVISGAVPGSPGTLVEIRG